MKIGKVKKSVPLFLVVGILIVCVGFFIVSCGSGISPQMKVEEHTRGQYAVDFSDCPDQATGTCNAVLESDVFENRLMAGKELTVEAWVKIHSTSTSGAFFGRMDNGGIFIYVKNGYPKVVVRRELQPTGTSDVIVGSLSSLVLDTWTHLAGVLSLSSNPTSTLSLYVDGISVASGAAVATTEPATHFMQAGAFMPGDVVDGVPKASELNGAVDEARLWGVARTQSEIRACKGEELGLDSGTCGRITDDLIGYWRFNEGSGDNVSEWSGLGGGFKEYPDTSLSYDPPIAHWNTGWTTGAPISAKD